MTSKTEFIDVFTTHIHREGAQQLLDWLEKTDFFTAPASTRFHGAYAGGLCEHSLNVWKELIRLLRAYPEIKVSAESAAICSLLHDLCKIGCYKTELRNKKVNGVWIQQPTYVFDEDFSYGGHGSKSVYLAQRFIRLSNQEATAINCHMGAWDRSPNDYSIGAAYEQNLFAWLVHVADESATYVCEGK